MLKYYPSGNPPIQEKIPGTLKLTAIAPKNRPRAPKGNSSSNHPGFQGFPLAGFVSGSRVIVPATFQGEPSLRINQLLKAVMKCWGPKKNTPSYMAVEPKIVVFCTPQIIHLVIGLSIMFTIHLFPTIFGNTHINRWKIIPLNWRVQTLILREEILEWNMFKFTTGHCMTSRLFAQKRHAGASRDWLCHLAAICYSCWMTSVLLGLKGIGWYRYSRYSGIPAGSMYGIVYLLHFGPMFLWYT